MECIGFEKLEMDFFIFLHMKFSFDFILSTVNFKNSLKILIEFFFRNATIIIRTIGYTFS